LSRGHFDFPFDYSYEDTIRVPRHQECSSDVCDRAIAGSHDKGPLRIVHDFEPGLPFYDIDEPPLSGKCHGQFGSPT
jgi:hypothetical protein